MPPTLSEPPWTGNPLAPPTTAGTVGVRQVRRDEHGRILEDIQCRSCGYNLRGLVEAGQCPECRVPIGQSIRGDLLQFSSPDWVSRLATGMVWILVGVFASIAGGIAIASVYWVLIGAGLVTPGLTIAVAATSFGLSLITFVGYWLFTTPDPGAVEQEPALSARAIARYALLATVIVSPMQSLTQSAAIPTAKLPTIAFDPVILALATLGFMCLQIIGLVAIATYARSLALRVPNASLANQTRIVMWGYLPCQVLASLSAITQQLREAQWLALELPDSRH